jgi:hypothetical protein
LVDKYYKTSTQVVLLSRGTERKKDNISFVHWDGKTIGVWAKEIDGSDLVINFSGKSVNCRYTEKNKKEIINSRVETTLAIGKAIQSLVNPPKLWINAGSAAIYGDGGSEIKRETSSLGQGFSAEVCKLWEKAFHEVETPATRKVYLRIGLVFGKNSWVLTPFIHLAKFGLGGKIGTGKQYISWIHKNDFLSLLDWIQEREKISGVLNCSSPNPLTNAEFMRLIRKEIGIPLGITHPKLFIQVGSWIIGTEAELVLTGRRVVSDILVENDFQFQFPTFDKAITQIISL